MRYVEDFDDMKDNRRQVMTQLNFCQILMNKLAHNIGHSDALYNDCGFENYTRHQDDIVRLRRELLTLSKMMDPYDNHKYV